MTAWRQFGTFEDTFGTIEFIGNTPGDGSCWNMKQEAITCVVRMDVTITIETHTQCANLEPLIDLRRVKTRLVTDSEYMYLANMHVGA